MAVRMCVRFSTVIFLSFNIGLLAAGIENSHMLNEADRIVRGTINHQTKYPKDCSGLSRLSPSGFYIIQPENGPYLIVLCDMTTEGGGWTVIQKNTKLNELTWKATWTTYKFGFGNVQGDHWLGNKYIHQITQQGLYRVRFIVYNRHNVSSFADYNMFSVNSETEGYRLSLGTYSGTAGDSMNYDRYEQDNMKFSTFDRDQDRYGSNCAHSYQGGWWFNNCYRAVLNVRIPYWQTLCCGNCKGSIILIKPNTDCCPVPRTV
ncbi:fibrinogen-like protein 1-like protein [Callorhinchus milii]|uniref:Fibrinogen-like protein A n=2 Tax=Callorhinchus milii TaxID=7868 RepID=A0A4W3ICI7_CALMI|nr:fibrinogen-like protein 1-like protein [Callorhinchus milii]|eukprot:gi/632957617/ref/XP_007894583.1/ PREDICTED: fibrinogen-like protein A [Callorhinchus milii]